MAELYRTKDDCIPVEVNRLTAENAEAVTAWCKGFPVVEHNALNHSVTYAAINVNTSNGMARAQEGDWVIKFYGDKFLILRDTAFHELFEPLPADEAKLF